MNYPFFDLAIIGGGPAGIAAALQSASAGISVALLDEGTQLGGHYYKQPFSSTITHLSFSQSKKMAEFDSLMAVLTKTNIKIFQGVHVWGIFNKEGKTINGKSNTDDVFRICFEPPYNSHDCIEAKALILATGVYDRPIPFPGWEMPGVVTPGAVQIQLEKQALLPGGKVLVAGSGPLQFVVAAELIRYGVDVIAVLDTSSFFDGWKTIFSALGGLKSRWLEGVQAGITLMRNRVPILFRHAVFRAIGDNQNGVQGVVYGRIDSTGIPLFQTARKAQVDVICCAYGFSPSIALSLHLGCKHKYDPFLGAWKPCYDDRLQTSVDRVFVAGDVTKVGGKPLALLQGRWAAISVLERLGAWTKETAEEERAIIKSVMRREEQFAQWLWTRYRMLPGLLQIADEETLICRCEGVRLAEIRASIEDGAADLFGIKLRTRMGMGQCQGRYCFSTTAMLLASYTGKNVSDLDLPTIRPPIIPVRLKQLAADRQVKIDN